MLQFAVCGDLCSPTIQILKNLFPQTLGNARGVTLPAWMLLVARNILSRNIRYAKVGYILANPTQCTTTQSGALTVRVRVRVRVQGFVLQQGLVTRIEVYIRQGLEFRVQGLGFRVYGSSNKAATPMRYEVTHDREMVGVRVGYCIIASAST